MSQNQLSCQVGLPDWRVILSTRARALAFAPLIAGAMTAAAARATDAQGLDTVGARIAAAARATDARGFDTTVGARAAGVAGRAGQAGQPARRFELTLDDAVQRALEQNLDIAVQRIHPLVQDMQVAAAGAAFLPSASSGFDFNQATAPNRSVFDGGGLGGRSIVTDQGAYDLGIGQEVRWGGGRYDVTWNTTREESTNIFSTFNPSFGANMTLQYTQPLLRGLRTDARRTQLVVSRIHRDISDIDLEETVVNTLADVSLAYWDLVYARAAVDVQRQALTLAEQFVEDSLFRVEVGTMAPIDVVQARSEAASRRQLLAQAVEAQRTNELILKELIVGGTSDPLWNAEIDPTDQPRIEATSIDLQEAIRAALDRRTDISRARRQLDINEATVRNLRDSALPALNLIGNYQLTGQGGHQLIPAGHSFEDIFGGTGGVLPGGYRDALQNIASADYPVWSVQLRMSYPLGRSAERAAHERARRELQQNEAQIRRIELRIASEVTAAALSIESIQERIEAATASRELAQEQLQAEESKFETGLSTNFFVLQSQRDLAAAQDAELRAILDYQRALIEFDRTQRASLGGAGIAVVGGAAPPGARAPESRSTPGTSVSSGR